MVAVTKSNSGHWPWNQFMAPSCQPGDFRLFSRDKRYQIHSPRDVVILHPCSPIDNFVLIVHTLCDTVYLPASQFDSLVLHDPVCAERSLGAQMLRSQEATTTDRPVWDLSWVAC